MRRERESKKPKFKPEITRVKLNPAQAVLACNCWSAGFFAQNALYYGGPMATICQSLIGGGKAVEFPGTTCSENNLGIPGAGFRENGSIMSS